MVAVWAHGTSVVPFPTHLVEGWRWALTKRNFLSAIILGAIVNIACVASITGAQIMLAARGANAVMIGLLGTAMGVSTLVGSLLANKLVDMVPTGKLIAGALTLFVVSQMPLLFLHSYAAILICQILAGLPFPALNAGLLGFHPTTCRGGLLPYLKPRSAYWAQHARRWSAGCCNSQISVSRR